MLALLRPDPAGPTRTWQRASTALLGTALALGLGVPFATAAAADDPTVGIAAAPAQQGQPDGRTRFSFSVSAGQQVSDTLLVRNSGSTEQQFDLYATDAYDTADGAFALLDGGATPSGAGTWVAFQGGSRTTTLSLAAGAQALVPFTVTVPSDAAPGDHAGGLVVSVTSSGGQVNVDRRLATRLYVRVQGTIMPALTVRTVTVSQPAGGNPFTGPATVTAVVENTGDVALAAHADAGVRTWFGRPLGSPVSTEVGELLPGATRTLTFDVGSVARAGYVAPYVRLTPAADADAYDFTLPAVERRGTAAAVPWLLAGVVLVVGAGAWLVVLRSRRARSARTAPVEGKPAPASATAGGRR